MKIRRFPYITVFTVIPVMANLIAVAASFVLNDYVYLDEERETFRRFTVAVPWAMWLFNALPFPAVMLAVYSYLWPLFRELRCFDGTPLSDRAASRLLNAPLVISALGMAGWVLGTSLSISLQVYYIRNVPFHGMLVTITNALCLGGITFVFSYYALDYVNRRVVILRFLGSRSLSEIPGVFRPSVTMRFFIFYFSVAVLPVLMVTQMLARSALAASGTLTPPVLLFPLAALFVGTVLSWLLARAFEQPLVEMKTAVQGIQQGSLEPQLTATSTDELGHLAEGINHMAQGLREKEFMKETFGKVVAPAVRDHLLKGNLQLGGEMRVATVLFCDLRGFTALSEKLTPAQVVEMLNVHFDTMSRCIEGEGGLINKFIGDAIMAVWGVPESKGNDALNAVNATIEMRRALLEFNKDRGSDKKPIIKIGSGLNTGPVLAGQIGSEDRLDYTVIGDAVNLASRVETLNKPFGTDILISEDTYKIVKDEFDCEPMQKIKVKGKSEPQQIYAVLRKKSDKNGPKNLAELRKLLGIDMTGKPKKSGDDEEVKYEILEK